MIFDPTPCRLGEGAIWHPERGELYWFDILNMRLLTAGRHWQFEELVSAAGWIDRQRLLIASSSALRIFDIESGCITDVCPLEADVPANRSNDGRADPMGGFWIGTMHVSAREASGTIYRWFRGELRPLFGGLRISNSICFAPDGRTAYFADTATQIIQRLALNPLGWPSAEPEEFINLAGTPFRPDGSVVDSQGRLWNAQWGTGRVACYGPAGKFVEAIAVPGRQCTCPAFGGINFSTLFCTTASEGLDGPGDGLTYAFETPHTGLPEPRVIL